MLWCKEGGFEVTTSDSDEEELLADGDPFSGATGPG